MPDSNQMATLSGALNKLAAKDLKEFVFTEQGMTTDQSTYYDADELSIIKKRSGLKVFLIRPTCL